MKRKMLFTGGVMALSAAMLLAGCQQAAPSKSPEEVVKDGMKKLTTVTSHEFEVAVVADVTGPKGQTPAKVKFNVTLAGAVDVKNPKDPKVNLKLDGSGNADDQSASGSAELRLNKENLYFDLAKLDIKGGEGVPPMLVGYIGKWWSFPIPAGALDQLTASLPTGGSSQESLSPAQQKMKALFENTQFFKNIKFVGVEDVKGEQSFHYTAEVDKDALQKVIVQTAEDNGQPTSADELKKLQDSLAKFDFVGNVWVGKDSGVLNQVSGDIKLPASDTDPTGTISIRVSLWNLNKPVTVTVPAGVTEFPLKGLLGGGDTTGDSLSGSGGLSDTMGVSAGKNGVDVNLDLNAP